MNDLLELDLSKLIEYIREYLEEKNYSVLAFSKLVGISDNVMNNWLSDTSTPSFNSLIILADYFDCSVEFLFGITEYNTPIKCKSEVVFVERLNCLLVERNYKANKLATKLKVSPKTVYNWSKGMSLPSAYNLYPLAVFFRVSIDYILCRTDER